MFDKEKFLDVIKKGDYTQVDENNFTVTSELFGEMNIQLTENYINTQMLDVKKGRYVLLVWGGSTKSGKRKFKHTNLNRRLSSFRIFMDDFLNADRLIVQDVIFNKV